MTARELQAVLLGSATAEVAELASALAAQHVVVPDVPSADDSWSWAAALESWRRQAAHEPPVSRVVVAVWADDLGEPVGLAEMAFGEWLQRAEVGFARWFAALGVAAARCRDGGAIVAVVERSAPLDCAGRAAETGVADGVDAVCRSLARAEGARGVRVNTVTTPLRTTRPPVVDPPPALATFPGRIEPEVAGAVRLLLDADATGVTGTVVHADCGRSWR